MNEHEKVMFDALMSEKSLLDKCIDVMNNPEIRITVDVPNKLHKEFKKQLRAEGMSMKSVMNQLISNYIEKSSDAKHLKEILPQFLIYKKEQ